MGCGGNSSGARQGGIALPKELTIHGNMMNSSTRSLVCICEMTSTGFKLNNVDTTKNDHKKKEYTDINPTATIPMLEEGHFRVLGGNHVIYVFLSKSKSSIAQKLMPQEIEQSIKGILGWHQAKMATPCAQMFRTLYESGVFSTKPTQASFDKWKNEVIDALRTLDEKLIN